MPVAQSHLEQFEPMAKLSLGRRIELADLVYAEKVNKDIDPLRMNITKAAQSIYLLKGDLELTLFNDKKIKLAAGSPAARYPINSNGKVKETKALTDVAIMRVDTDLLDIMMTWDQISDSKPAPTSTVAVKQTDHERTPADWMKDTQIFSAYNLQKGIFSHLPAVNIEEMFNRMTSIEATAGQVMIQQGGVGDYYYLIQSGTAIVSRVVDSTQPPVLLAELKQGRAFGEDALISEAKRNATVTMKTDGRLLRLNKTDFIELLKAPLITQVDMEEAQQKVAEGAVWIDARLPSEFEDDHIAGAMNIPLNEVRQHASSLDKSKTYIVYCQTGRRSSAAAFVLTQCGINAMVLKGGTRIIV
ncbi:MAG: cyclic nucleotide-binding protein [Methylotenera sp.]|jgi:rhodanese-related sulfurtransferase|nr:MAG: cyclic nucleotide-binding protein [Methylotenera sp.]